MRGWLKDVRSYLPPVQIGEVIRGTAIAKVLASKSSKFAVGCYVTTRKGWTEVAIANAKDFVRLVEIPKNGELTDALGVLGYTGLTAHFGIVDIGEVKVDDFVVVSGAAGTTGSVACQIAKLKGARVLGIAGSDDKVQWLKELGCDDALNYKDADFSQKFNDATTDLIDVYYDNVGGYVLDLALSRAKINARIVMCGSLCFCLGIRAELLLMIVMKGFLVLDYTDQFPTTLKELASWLSEGKLQSKDTIIKGGLQAAEEGLLGLYSGINTGKLLVEIKTDEGVGFGL